MCVCVIRGEGRWGAAPESNSRYYYLPRFRVSYLYIFLLSLYMCICIYISVVLLHLTAHIHIYMHIPTQHTNPYNKPIRGIYSPPASNFNTFVLAFGFPNLSTCVCPNKNALIYFTFIFWFINVCVYVFIYAALEEHNTGNLLFHILSRSLSILITRTLTL